MHVPHCFYLTRCLLLHRSSGVICAHLHMRSDTDQALDHVHCAAHVLFWLDRHNSCLFTPPYSLAQPLPLLKITFYYC